MRSQPRARLQPAPGGHAAHLGDGRLGQPVQGERHVADVAHRRRAGARRSRAAASTRRRQVGARAERATGTGEDDDPVVGSCAPISRNVASSSSHIVPLIAFFFSGRFSVTVTMPPSGRVTSIVSIGADDTVAVGFNPYRQRPRPAGRTTCSWSPSACWPSRVGLVLWALARVTRAPRSTGTSGSARSRCAGCSRTRRRSATGAPAATATSSPASGTSWSCRSPRPTSAATGTTPAGSTATAAGPAASRRRTAARTRRSRSTLRWTSTPGGGRRLATSKRDIDRAAVRRGPASASHAAASRRSRACLAGVTASTGEPNAVVRAGLHLAEHDEPARPTTRSSSPARPRQLRASTS